MTEERAEEFLSRRDEFTTEEYHAYLIGIGLALGASGRAPKEFLDASKNPRAMFIGFLEVICNLKHLRTGIKAHFNSDPYKVVKEIEVQLTDESLTSTLSATRSNT